MHFTERAGRFRDVIPPADRQKLLQLVDRIAADPEADSSHLAYTNDSVTRSAWHGRVMVLFVVTSRSIVILEADIYDAARGFNEV
ncbi:hypothetical protein GTY65_40055 [Streptomyces sp. SID8379]|nr:hypothetical protein [Streptomyces sp. SID8379]